MSYLPAGTLLALVFVLSSFVSTGIRAGDFRTGDTVLVAQPIADDLYAAGGTVGVNAPVSGDLVAAGGTVTQNAPVSQDILAAGATVDLKGTVSDDVRAVAGTLVVSGSVAGDIVAAGGTISISNAQVGGDLTVAGGTVTIHARTNRNARIAGGQVTFGGRVGGELHIRGETVTIDGEIVGPARIGARRIVLGKSAVFRGPVSYWSDEPVDFGNAQAKKDESLRPDSRQARDPTGVARGLAILALLFRLLTAPVTAVVLALLFGSFAVRAAGDLRNSTGPVLGTGAVFLLMTPAAIVALFVTIIGIPLALVWLAAAGSLALVSHALLGVVLAALYLGRAGPFERGAGFVAVSAIAAATLVLLAAIPFVGWLFGIALHLVAAGLVLREFKRLRERTG